ncbi:cache domain-containing protein [Pseudoalteromonas carrageenovora]|uniref:cache domain-containing protein n=1 Tax=Pseudoalteromonas carrageenovora TaxID=227 RepID=UPI002118EF29|nr:cache domain-containing protein [Pseudoalteromonas carrageenovora]MCQ8889918.1 cache domain-containing protein [Pseudoalteromonas carrageenovora]MDO6837038.1 cache domain-containing protein [Pseudoalteromonas carrageenovora]
MPAYFFFMLLGLSEPLKFGSNLPTTSPDNAVNQVQCILYEMGTPFKLHTLPWLRARREVKLHRLDGYFTTHLTPEMKAYGKITSPVFLEKWYWFTHPDSVNKPEEKIHYGAVRGSYQANWLKSQNIQVQVEVNSIEEIIKILHHQRVDRILLDLDDFEHVTSRLEIDQSAYSKEFFRYVPLGLFASNSLIKRFPNFMSQFDDNLATCSQTPFSLSKSEKDHVLGFIYNQAKALAAQASLTEQTLISNSLPLSEDELIKADKQWQTEVKNEQAKLGKLMLDKALSKKLNEWQSQFNGSVTEVILTDNQGKNVAISKLTSDYWQGDEDKFNKVFTLIDDYYFDNVEYDASTHHFQVQLSIPVFNEHYNHIGVLIIGIDVEKALRLNASLRR